MSKVIGRPMWAPLLIGAALWLVLTPSGRCDAGRMLQPTRHIHDSTTSPNVVRHRCLTPEGNDERLGGVSADRWQLPAQALAADFDTTIHCLVLRYNFQYETVDNANTTGRGWMDMSRPLDTLTDEEYIEREGYLIDPPPHDSLYFDAHMRALNRYWETVSGGRVHLQWDIYPPYRDSIYELPHPMSYYGRCDFSDVVSGLEDFFVDCIKMADTLNPEIDFSDYQAFFLFHAGSDGQSDIGFPATCADLFSGFIKFAGDVWVDDSTHSVRSGLMMPETTVQDGRVTALNAVLAHEFGHQLGLIDIYSTQNFFTQLGDFSLMDNNGFGTGIEFAGFTVGKVFGAIPVFPDAWSRAFLGFEEVVDFRSDTTDVEITAAEMTYDDGLKIARLPVSEYEYYLIENRIEEVDGDLTYVLMDSVTSVIQGPVDPNRTFTGEYDFLLPGSGVLILHVDEEVARLDYDGDGVSNFEDNDAQWSVDDRKFVRLVEADGLVHFGGYYYAGYGDPGDLFRDDRADAFTPNTNPETVDNSGNQTHFYVENIGRAIIPGGRDDRYVTFDFSVDRKVDGFPTRAGLPQTALAPIADDLDGNGTIEIIMAAGPYVSVVTSHGDNFMDSISTCGACVPVYDEASTSVNRGTSINPVALYPLPLYATPPTLGTNPTPWVSAGPVTGRWTTASDSLLVVIGHAHPNPALAGAFGLVTTIVPRDVNGDARADVEDTIRTIGRPIALGFADTVLFGVSSTLRVDRWWRDSDGDSLARSFVQLPSGRLFCGMCLVEQKAVVLVCDTALGVNGTSWLYVVSDDTSSIALDGLYLWGPVGADMDRDGNFEIAAFTPDGEAVLITIDLTGAEPSFNVMAQRETGRLIMTQPSAGDIDLDGYPEILVGGRNELLAFNAELVFKTDFPLSVDDRFPDADLIAAPLIADIASSSQPETVVPSNRGNFYSFDRTLSYGFPLSSGEQEQFYSGSPAVLFGDADGGKMGWLGGDGWFYAWEVEADTTTDFWPMNGCNPAGTFVLETGKLPTPAAASTEFDDAKFYNYPNPVRGDETTIRYFLGDDASGVTLNIFDLSGKRVAQLDGRTQGGTDNEVIWNCSDVTSGVYRCVIKVDFAGESKTAFTDIAVIR